MSRLKTPQSLNILLKALLYNSNKLVDGAYNNLTVLSALGLETFVGMMLRLT